MAVLPLLHQVADHPCAELPDVVAGVSLDEGGEAERGGAGIAREDPVVAIAGGRKVSGGALDVYLLPEVAHEGFPEAAQGGAVAKRDGAEQVGDAFDAHGTASGADLAGQCSNLTVEEAAVAGQGVKHKHAGVLPGDGVVVLGPITAPAHQLLESIDRPGDQRLGDRIPRGAGFGKCKHDVRTDVRVRGVRSRPHAEATLGPEVLELAEPFVDGSLPVESRHVEVEGVEQVASDQ